MTHLFFSRTYLLPIKFSFENFESLMVDHELNTYVIEGRCFCSYMHFDGEEEFITE
jgi:hypothetical protein